MSLTPDEVKLAAAAIEQAAKPFAGMIRALFGGAFEEIGGMLTDSFRARRLSRLLTLVLPKLKAQFEASGIPPASIPDNIWAPALEAATLTDDETLQEKWAALLLNANPNSGIAVKPSFVEILKQLSPLEACMLDKIFDVLRVYAERHAEFFNLAAIQSRDITSIELCTLALESDGYDSSFLRWCGELGLCAQDLAMNIEEMSAQDATLSSDLLVARDNLLRNMLMKIKERDEQILINGEPPPANPYAASVSMTMLGFEFVRACRTSARGGKT
ncbi:MAG: Abi-alpha family protein [Candidatus Acidiferrales bacterium]